MSKLEKAKEYYHHKEYKTAIKLILELINEKTINENSIEYPNILYYLEKCRLELYKTSKNKVLLYEARTDFATAENRYRFFFKIHIDHK